MDKSDIPDLAKVIFLSYFKFKIRFWFNFFNIKKIFKHLKAPSSLLEALESHVNGVDSKKSTTSVTGAASSVNSK